MSSSPAAARGLGLGGRRRRALRSTGRLVGSIAAITDLLDDDDSARRAGSGAGAASCGMDCAGRRRVQLAHVARQQREVGVEAVGAGAQRLDQRAELALHRVDALEHQRGRLMDLADVVLRAFDRLVADALGLARGVLRPSCAPRSRASRSIAAALDSAASTIACTWALAIVASDAPRSAGASADGRRRCLRALQRLDLARRSSPGGRRRSAGS